MGDIATYVNGAAFKPRDWSSSGRPIIRIQNLNDPSATFNYFSGTIDSKYLVQKGDILVSWATHLEAYIWNGDEAWLNQHIFKVVFNKTDVDKTFFLYAANVALKEAFKKAHGFKASMEHIKRGDFEDAVVYLPDLDTQRQFAVSLFFGIDVHGYVTTLCATLFLGGIIELSVGVLGEYIGRIYIETKRRPIYICSETNIEDEE